MPSNWVVLSSGDCDMQSYYSNRITWIVSIDPFTRVGLAGEEEEQKPKLGFFND